MYECNDLAVGKVHLPAGVAQIAMRSNVPLVIADALEFDLPLIVVNAAFCNMAGRDPDEMLGRNCRFLQPPEGAGPPAARIRDFLASPDAREGNFVLPNVRKDGTRFLNMLFLAKLDSNGTTTHIVGSQFDITTESVTNLKSYGATLQNDIGAMNIILRAHGWNALPTHEDLTETIAYVETYRMVRG